MQNSNDSSSQSTEAVDIITLNEKGEIAISPVPSGPSHLQNNSEFNNGENDALSRTQSIFDGNGDFYFITLLNKFSFLFYIFYIFIF